VEHGGAVQRRPGVVGSQPVGILTPVAGPLHYKEKKNRAQLFQESIGGAINAKNMIPYDRHNSQNPSLNVKGTIPYTNRNLILIKWPPPKLKKGMRTEMPTLLT
jgi:hypothetical protein